MRDINKDVSVTEPQLPPTIPCSLVTFSSCDADDDPDPELEQWLRLARLALEKWLKDNPYA